MNAPCLRRLRFIKRWGVVPTLTLQNVAEHSFHTAWVYVCLARAIGFQFSVDELVAVLEHDQEEALTGDLPTPSKPRLNLHILTEHELLMKLADLVEAMLFIVEEQHLGNKCLDDVKFDVNKRLCATVEALSNKREWIASTLSLAVEDIFAKCIPSSHPCMTHFYREEEASEYDGMPF